MPLRTPLRTPRRSASAGLLLLVLATFFGAAATAQAGTYRVWSCNTPAGKPTSVEGWEQHVVASYSASGNNCGAGNGLDMLFGFADGVTHGGGQGVTWQFTAPANTTVGKVSLSRNYSVNANGGDLQAGAGIGYYRGDFIYDSGHLIGACISFSPCTGTFSDRISFDAGGETKFGFDAGCYGPANDPNVHCAGAAAGGGRAFNSAKAISIDLNDTTSPTASDPAGTILDAGVRSGVETLTFKTADVGGGVWQAEVKLGDKVVTPRTLIDSNGGRCAEVDVDAAVGNEFGYPVPCKTSTVTANLNVPTTAVANGSYLLTATVFDVAGNATNVVSRKVTVDNGAAGVVNVGPVNGTGGAAASGTLALTATTRKNGEIWTHYGGKIDLTGRLTDGAGVAISAATLDVFETVKLAGAGRTPVGTVTTDAAGNFTYRPKTHSSKTVEFGFPERVGLTTYRSVLAVPVSVGASISLKVSRKKASRGQLVRFTGKVRVDPFPPKGVRVAIEVKTGKKWQVAANVRARTAGAYSWTHRFHTRGPYQFRARVLGAGDLPARPAASTIKRMSVR